MRTRDLPAASAGLVFGDQRFRKGLLAELAGGMGVEHYGEERWESEVERAEGLVRGELRKAGWENEKLGATPKGHKVKWQEPIVTRNNVLPRSGGSVSVSANSIPTKSPCRT